MTSFHSVNGNIVISPGGVTVGTTSFPEQARLLALCLDGRVATGNVNFAMSISTSRNPSTKQLSWCRKLESEVLSKANMNAPWNASHSAYASYDVTIDMTHIMSMFETARQNLKRPKITLLLNDDPNAPVRFSFNRAKTYIWMNTNRFGEAYGIIEVATGGVQLKQFGRTHKDALLVLLAEFASAPQALAVRHGKLSGNCCFCSLKLTDARSTHHGYGHRCARNWHMPWGEKGEAATQVGDWVFGAEPTK